MCSSVETGPREINFVLLQAEEHTFLLIAY